MSLIKTLNGLWLPTLLFHRKAWVLLMQCTRLRINLNQSLLVPVNQLLLMELGLVALRGLIRVPKVADAEVTRSEAVIRNAKARRNTEVTRNHIVVVIDLDCNMMHDKKRT